MTTEASGYESAAKITGMKNSSASGLVDPPSAATTTAVSAIWVTLQSRKNGSRQRLRTTRSCGISTNSRATIAHRPNSEAISWRSGWSQVAAT